MLDRRNAITNEVIEKITFVLAYPTVSTFLEINLFQPPRFNRSNSWKRIVSQVL